MSWRVLIVGIPSIVLAVGLGCASAPETPPADREEVAPEENIPLSEAEQLEADRAVLTQLREAGADLTKPTHIIHYLYFATEDAANAARAQVAAPLSGTVDDAEGEWELAVEHDAVPTLDNIARVRQLLMAVAAHQGGAYDGWEAAVTP